MRIFIPENPDENAYSSVPEDDHGGPGLGRAWSKDIHVNDVT
jgi:hypothetical protein